MGHHVSTIGGGGAIWCFQDSIAGATVLMNMGIALKALDQLSDAEGCTRRALERYDNFLGPKDTRCHFMACPLPHASVAIVT